MSSKIIVSPLTLERTPSFPENMGFGRYFTNRMFIQKYTPTKQWHAAEITQLKPLEFHPAIEVFHSGQNIFEGIKAYRSSDGEINIFRLKDHLERFNVSAKRMAMPEIPINLHTVAIRKLVDLERDWVPSTPNCALYIRPVMIGTEHTLEVRASSNFLHYIILSIVGPYFGEPLQPVSVYISDEFVRAPKGGTGAAKTAANYAGSILASELAAKQGYSQVLWLDATHRRYIEELGGMNIMFVRKNNEIITPQLTGSILPGITRKSIFELAPLLGLTLKEETLDIQTVIDEIQNHSITEAFAIGTGAVIAPIGKFGYKDREYLVNNNKTGLIARQLFDSLSKVQYGENKDLKRWLTKV